MKKSKKPKKNDKELITVKSDTYGEHQRAKRGTYTEVTLNDTMKMSSKELGISNQDASLIRKELLPYFYNEKPRKFWPRLLSLTRACYTGRESIDPTKLINFEVYEEYKISRLAAPLFKVNAAEDLITVELKWSAAPDFKRKFPDGYIYGALCVFIDRMNSRSESTIKYSKIFPLHEQNGYCLLDFENKLEYDYALIFLILHPTQKNKTYTGAASSAFRCIWADKLQKQNKEDIDELVISNVTSA